jgi:heme/copper-type cytochrome/quinol oxidase subunit 2
LLSLASPSFSLLYSLDEISSPKLSLKIIGHQWHWSYETSDVGFCSNNGNNPPLKHISYYKICGANNRDFNPPLALSSMSLSEHFVRFMEDAHDVNQAHHRAVDDPQNPTQNKKPTNGELLFLGLLAVTYIGILAATGYYLLPLLFNKP